MKSTLIASPRHGLAHFLVAWRWWLFGIGCLLAIPLTIQQRDLGMDRSLASMFASDDPTLLQYQHLQRTFGGNLVVMLVYDDPDLMTAEGVRRSQAWTAQAESLPGVRGVLSIAKLVEAFHYIQPPMSLSDAASFLTSESSDSKAGATSGSKMLSQDDPIALAFRGMFAGYTHSPDEETAAIVAMLDTDQSQAAVEGLRALAEQLPQERRPVLVGEPVLLDDAFDLIEQDGNRLAMGTIGLLSLVMLLTLRDYRVVLLAILTIAWSTVATRASMVVLGMEMSLVSTILIAIIAVITVASVMHVGIRMKDRVTTASQNHSAAIAFLAVPIVWTCLTDAAGFASLLQSDVQPVKQFGAMTGIAAISIVLSLLWFTAAMMKLPGWRRFSSDESALRQLEGSADASLDGRFHQSMMWLVCKSLHHRKGLTGLAVLGLIVSTFLAARLPTETSFLKNFRDDSPIVQAYERVERELGGAGVWDVVLPAPEVITPEYAERVRKLQTQLRQVQVVSADDGETHRLTKVLSLADADGVAAMSPLLAIVTPEIRLAGMRAAIPTFAEALLTFEPSGELSSDPIDRELRIMLRSKEHMPGDVKQDLIAKVTQVVHEFDEDASVTGYSVMMSRLVDSLMRDQWQALIISLLLVGALIAIATRSVRYAMAALLTNSLPVMLVLTVMGWLGGGLNLGSAMIGAVSIGLSIDGSIHFLAGYQRRLSHGMRPDLAAAHAATDVATPILLATLALVVGFAILISSPFIPTATFGTLIAATLAASAIINLTLLPAAVVAFESRLFDSSNKPFPT
ncbi:efflux RND transporter permease subunit [Rhodopirellula halodulae]|uniref:efflux RND transporter permease subunit n=1 Tax=Rhodopirellula halodulae TaxID=2894198 RepID=UPI001E4F25F2|nr:MMPL family transporter [Rhodopirellula sp. JC737]MCC9654411.1 MMPL family transporter [Rhodopirellula sp. JC737]